jgi:dCTP deaminase
MNAARIVATWLPQIEAVFVARGMTVMQQHRPDRVSIAYRSSRFDVSLGSGAVKLVHSGSSKDTTDVLQVLVANGLLTSTLEARAGRWKTGHDVGHIKLLASDAIVGPSGGTLIDRDIALLCTGEYPMLSPYEPQLVRTFPDGRKIPSYGQSSCGYDVRCEPLWRPFKKQKRGDKPMDPMDPSTFDDKVLSTSRGETYVIAPGECVLSVTVERFMMPHDVFARCLGKSTWARLCIVVNVTPLEPGWEGTLVMELSNTGNRSVMLRAGVGIAQIVFERLSGRPGVTYADRGGKYQGQTGIQPALV